MISRFGNVVPAGYAYAEKLVVPAEALRIPQAWLKWYDIHPAQSPVTPAQRDEARGFIAAEAESGRLELKQDLGFVILHRAGSVLLLLLTTWRNTNEMWETVWVKPVDGPEQYRLVPQESSHKATYCVWELGAVWHERNAWVEFLASTRDDPAKEVWLESLFTGSV